MNVTSDVDVLKVLNGIQLLLNLMWSHTFQALPPPFRVIWNYPDQVCRRSNVTFNLEHYGIESNKNDFIENTISLFYAQRFGSWPYIEMKNKTWINGGLPQYANMSAHLKALNNGITKYRHGGAAGFGVLNMELWRPVFRTNYGRFSPYIPITINHVVDENPGLPESLHMRISQQIWEVSTRYLMESSLSISKLARPSEKWGYYRYPELSTYRHNDKLAWLWKSVTAYYPSIYIKNFDRSINDTKTYIIKQIAEAFRVRALFGNPDNPIMVYTVAQTFSLGMFQGRWLDLAIRLPVEMGVDGLILWASSKEFTNPAEAKCRKQKSYIKRTLGPKIKLLLAKMTRCSAQLCSGRGRCVRKIYAERVDYVKDRGVPKPEVHVPPQVPPNRVTIEAQFPEKFACQCYASWTGEFCRQRY